VKRGSLRDQSRYQLLNLRTTHKEISHAWTQREQSIQKIKRTGCDEMSYGGVEIFKDMFKRVIASWLLLERLATEIFGTSVIIYLELDNNATVLFTP
jgi:hypothetical protein